MERPPDRARDRRARRGRAGYAYHRSSRYPSTDDAAIDADVAKRGFFEPDARTNPDHIRYALKTTAAAMFCYLLYQQLDWQGIHTCFITCYMVSLGTTAETDEKLTLRIAGCIVGALLGTAAIVFVMPALTSAGELTALVFAGAWAAAWVAMGSPRISYAGMQVAFAFFLCAIQGAAPGFDLTLARDRAIGILLGNVVVYLVFTRVWPVSIASRIDAALDALVAQWARIARAKDADSRRTQTAAALAQHASLRQDLGLIHYAPSWVRPPPDRVASRRRTLAELDALEGPLFLLAERAAGEDGLADVDARLRRVARNASDAGDGTSANASDAGNDTSANAGDAGDDASANAGDAGNDASANASDAGDDTHAKARDAATDAPHAADTHAAPPATASTAPAVTPHALGASDAATRHADAEAESESESEAEARANAETETADADAPRRTLLNLIDARLARLAETARQRDVSKEPTNHARA